MTEKQKTITSRLIFPIGAVLGALVFIWIFGTAIIAPSNTGWIFEHPDDTTQHHLGWVFYRHTPWTFPICMTDGLTSDGAVSCMYTDSLPLFAIFFKLLSPILPETFQYFGIWGVVCFALNGGFGALLLSRIKNNIFFTSVGSLFYSMFFPSIARITHHNSLGAIWLIMIAMILTLDHDRKYKRSFTPIALWTLTCMAATLIHIYFIPMVYFVMAGYIILVYFRDKNRLKAILTFVSSTVFSLLTLYVIGAFEGNSSYRDGGYGIYSSNLNTFFNSMGHSKYLRQLNTTQGQGEGYGYLGLGMLVCCFLAIIIAITRLERKNGSVIKNAAAYIKKHRVEAAAFTLVFMVSFMWAVTTTVAFNQKVIINVPPAEGNHRRTFHIQSNGQIYMVSLPDSDDNGIMAGIKARQKGRSRRTCHMCMAAIHGPPQLQIRAPRSIRHCKGDTREHPVAGLEEAFGGRQRNSISAAGA